MPDVLRPGARLEGQCSSERSAEINLSTSASSTCRCGEKRSERPRRLMRFGDRSHAPFAKLLEARDASGGLIESVTDRQILAAYRLLAAQEAVFGELASAASVAGLLQAREEGHLDAGARVVCTITGNGLKDPDWAVSAAPAPVTIPVDAATAAAALGLA